MTNKEEIFVIERVPEFFEASEPLSAFINGLNLNPNENNELVRLVCAQVNAAERSGFAYGIKVGVKIKEADMTTPTSAKGFSS